MARTVQWIICTAIWLLLIHVTNNTRLVPCPDEENYFYCGDQTGEGGHQCIPRDQKCNGISECYNAEDESVATCGCPGEFQCDNSTCISHNLRCNMENDCDDGRDEENCDTYTCPANDFFTCDNHFCIPYFRHCDFHDDCGDNSDEKHCAHKLCDPFEWKCDNGKCVLAAFLCDGTNDCIDGSDERNCSRHVLCENDLYVSDRHACDGWVDCKHSMTDELHCGACQENQYTCSNTRCIENGHLCDGICDCGQNCDDESQCEETICSKDKFVCRRHGSQNRCLHPSAVCDGINHCRDFGNGYDEKEKYCSHTPIQCEGLPVDQIGLCKWCINRENGSCNKFIQYACEPYSNCSYHDDKCDSDQFMCGDQECIPLKERCDTVLNCKDLSDEIGCEKFECGEGKMKCENGQCVDADRWCDFHRDCIDGTDESQCDRRACKNDEFTCTSGQCIPLKNTCLYHGMAERKRDCVDKSHLHKCGDAVCPPGYMKCRNSYCVPDSFKCDATTDCVTFTDNYYCEKPCPYGTTTCTCYDKEMFCEDRGLTEMINTEEEPGLTVFHLAGNRIGQDFTNDSLLLEHKVALIDLSNNSIQALYPGTFRRMQNLQTLILSHNSISNLVERTFYGPMELKSLILDGNGITDIEPGTFLGLNSLTNLNLSYQKIWQLRKDTFMGLKKLYTLTLDHNSLEFIENGAFNDLSRLKKLDLSHNLPDLIVQEYVFNGLLHLHELSTDHFRFCCLARTVEICTPEPDEFSSCEDLMSNIILRVSIWILGILSLLGNALVIMWRVYDKRDSKVHSFLISHLAVADMMMGLYLMIIAGVDTFYRGRYIAYDLSWRTSQLCHFAGFLSTFSSELSVFTLTVITLDRFFTIIFPFHIHRMGIGCARLVMAAMWGLSVFVSVIPLCGIPYFMDFYSRSGVCLALHITNDRPNGWEYSVFVFLVLNLVSFIVIFVAYMWMFIVANKTRSAVRRDEVQSRSDMAMAKRMTLIVSTDFCCWVPIIILGFSSLAGAKIPPQVYAWVAVFILPFNSAINPILYTISTTTFLKQARRKANKFRKSFISSLAPVPETRISVAASEERISLQDRTPKIYNRIASCEDSGSQNYSRKTKAVSQNNYKQ